MLGSGDVLLVLLEPDAGVFSVPSKVLTYHCAGRPILGALPHDNLAARIIGDNGSGLVVEPGDRTVSSRLRRRSSTIQQRRRAMAEAARDYAERTFDIDRITDEFDRILRSVSIGAARRRADGGDVLIAAVGALVLLALVLWFVSLEFAGRRHDIFVALVVVVLVEAVIAGGGADVPIGILRPSFFGQDFRIPDAIIVAALAARILVAPWRRIGPLTMVWTPFVVVYATGSLIGFINDLPTIDVLFQSKMLFYLVGGAVVASGADLRRTRRLHRNLCARAGAAGADRVAAADLRHRHRRRPRRSSGCPGSVGSATTRSPCWSASGRQRSSSRRSENVHVSRVVLAAVVLMLAPLSSAQRASYLSLAAVVVVLGLVALGPTWHRRVHRQYFAGDARARGHGGGRAVRVRRHRVARRADVVGR